VSVNPKVANSPTHGFHFTLNQDILIGASAGQENEMVEMFTPRGPVISRLGTEGQIEIQSLQDEDVNDFIRGVIAYVRDPAGSCPRRS
jgi:hypothetical protein